jgi:hypothetical protein
LNRLDLGLPDLGLRRTGQHGRRDNHGTTDTKNHDGLTGNF